MLIPVNPRPRRRTFRMPPALPAMAAIFMLGVAALAQTGLPTSGASPASFEPGAPTTAPAAHATKTVLELFTSGGVVMYILAGFSVIAVAIIFERMYALRRGQVLPRVPPRPEGGL